MATIVGNTTPEQHTFDVDDIKEMGLLNGPYGLQEVADILAANVEVPTVNGEGIVEIIPSNFNDSYCDMIADLIGTSDASTELQHLKTSIEEGESCVSAYENVDLDLMRAEGDGNVADMISQVLALVGSINDAADIE